MSTNCNAPIELDDLLAYRFGELDPAQSERVEQHYFSCDACSRRLEALERLGQWLTQAVRDGIISATVTPALLERVRRDGLRVRSYRVGAGEQVACTCAPTDDFVALHLILDVAASAAVDVAVAWTDLERGLDESRTVQDVARDPSSREVVLLFAARQIREFPRSHWRMQAIVRDTSGERRIGPYTLNHTPWDQLESGG